jgi:hypothetical protein
MLSFNATMGCPPTHNGFDAQILTYRPDHAKQLRKNVVVKIENQRLSVDR